jgi:hypothetical protein
VTGRAGASEGVGCPKENDLLVSAALLPAFEGPKLNAGLIAAGGAGDGVPNVNDFFSAGAGGAGAPNEKDAGADTGFSSAGAVLGRTPSEKPGVVDEPCVPKSGLGASITGAGGGTGDIEGADTPNEKAPFDDSVVTGASAGCSKENAGLDDSAAGAGTTGASKLHGEAEGAAPKVGLLTLGSTAFEVSTAGGGAPNENGREDVTGRGAEERVRIPSTGVASFGAAGVSNEMPAVVAEVPEIEVLVDAVVVPNTEVVAGATDDIEVA